MINHTLIVILSTDLNIQRVLEISTLISSRQEQQNFYVSVFRNMYVSGLQINIYLIMLLTV
jgi:hypothetical protein